jgi:PAS domain-containing protein
VQSFALSVLFIAGFTALLFILASIFLVIKPLRAINESLRQAVDNPDGADAFQLKMRRRDELGQIATSLNMLLTSVSVVYQDELSAIENAIDGFGFGIIQYDHEGRVVAANPAAIEIFKVSDFNALRKMNRNCAAPLGARKAEPQPILSVLGDTREPILLTIHTEFGYFTAMAYCVSIRRNDSSILRQFAAIMPMDDILHSSRKAITDANKVTEHNQKLKIEAREMRRLFESCLSILELSNHEPSQIEEAILPDRILNAWYSEALSDELVSGRLEHGLLPGVRGEPEAVRTVLRQAMLLVYSQTFAERPVLKVEAEHLDEKRIGLTISDKSSQRSINTNMRRKRVDPTLPRAALTAALKHAGGDFGSLEMHEGKAELKFSLSKGNLIAEGVELLKSA